jgi:hypothetical protein
LFLRKKSAAAQYFALHNEPAIGRSLMHHSAALTSATFFIAHA